MRQWNVFISQNHNGLCQREWNFSGTAGECLEFLRSHRYTEGSGGNGFSYNIFKTNRFQNIYSTKQEKK